MARPKKKRVPLSPITQSEYDGLWHGYLTVGKKPNGKPDVRHRSGRTYNECAEKILQLEDEVSARKGRAPKAGASPLMTDALRAWYQKGCEAADGERPRWKYKTQVDYRLTIEEYLIPHCGGHRVDAFVDSKEHTEHIIDTVKHEVSVHAARKAYRVLRSWNSDAVRDELVDRNVVKLVREPVPEHKESEYLTPKEGEAVLAEVMKMGRYRARWLMAITMGERQSQCLGVRWHDPDNPRLPGDVDLDEGVIWVRKKLLRRTWQHGCDDPHACGSKPRPGKPHGVHKVGRPACPGSGAVHDRYHKRGKGCPPPIVACKPGCVRHAAACPDRHGGGLVLEDPKTAAGVRGVPMPKVTWDAFRAEKRLQDQARLRAGNLWKDTGLCFTTDRGTALDPRNDYEQWQELLSHAGVDPTRLHSARHLARIVLGILRVPKAVVRKILGQATDMDLVYDHAPDDEVVEAMEKVNEYWFGRKTSDPGPDRPTGRRPTPKRKPAQTEGGVVLQFRPRAS